MKTISSLLLIMLSALIAEANVGTASVVALADSREYTLAIAAEHGIPDPPVGLHAYAWKASVTCSVEEVAADGWMFMGWIGDVITDYTLTNIVVLLDTLAVSVEASFSEDADGDGLLNTNEFVIGSNPRDEDTDADGFDDAWEVVNNSNPVESQSMYTDYIRENGKAFGLFDSNAVLEVAVGAMKLVVSNGMVYPCIQLQQSDSQASWHDAGAMIEWVPFDMTDQKYYRVLAEPSP